MTARLIQAKALLLLLVFLAAGTSLPSLDALAYHGAAAAGQPAPSDTTEKSDSVTSPETAAPQAAGPRGANLLNPQISTTGDERKLRGQTWARAAWLSESRPSRAFCPA